MKIKQTDNRDWSKTAEDGDGNVGKTIKLITKDKKRTWICEIKLTFVPSCSQMRLQLLKIPNLTTTTTTSTDDADYCDDDDDDIDAMMTMMMTI